MVRAQKQAQTLSRPERLTRSGFTPQYNGLEELHKEYHDKGLEVLGFPSNEFGGQEPGTDDDIAQFCQVSCSGCCYWDIAATDVPLCLPYALLLRCATA